MDPSSLSLHTAALFVCLFDDFVEPFEAKAALLFYIEVLFSWLNFENWATVVLSFLFDN